MVDIFTHIRMHADHYGLHLYPYKRWQPTAHETWIKWRNFADKYFRVRLSSEITVFRFQYN